MTADRLEFTPFKEGDFAAFRAALAAQLGLAEPGLMRALADPAIPATLSAAAQAGFCWTGWHQGRPVGIAGLIEKWSGTARAWAIFSPAIPKQVWVQIARFGAIELDRAARTGYRRIEASCDARYAPGTRLLAALDFRLETPRPARAYGPNGEDHYLWARVVARETAGSSEGWAA